MSWFRWYEGSCEDAKFRVTARNANVTVATVMGVWALLLEDASHKDHRGIATRGMEYHTIVSGLADDELQNILGAMECVGLITDTDDGIVINSWQKRQFETDKTDATNAERQRRHRERKKTVTHNGTVTARNGDETAAKRPESESESESDTEPKPNGRVRSEDFEKFWKAYPRLEGNPKGPAWAEWQKAMKAGEAPAIIIAAAARYDTASKKPDAPKVAHARTWLHQCRWRDWADAPAPLPVSAVLARSEREVWAERLAKYKPGAPWLWGARPETGYCDAPADLITEWAARIEGRAA